jgi:hypothetical protein
LRYWKLHDCRVRDIVALKTERTFGTAANCGAEIK